MGTIFIVTFMFL